MSRGPRGGVLKKLPKNKNPKSIKIKIKKYFMGGGGSDTQTGDRCTNRQTRRGKPNKHKKLNLKKGGKLSV